MVHRVSNLVLDGRFDFLLAQVWDPHIFCGNESPLCNPATFSLSLINPEKIRLHMEIRVEHLWLEAPVALDGLGNAMGLTHGSVP